MKHFVGPGPRPDRIAVDKALARRRIAIVADRVLPTRNELAPRVGGDWKDGVSLPILPRRLGEFERPDLRVSV